MVNLWKKLDSCSKVAFSYCTKPWK